jgi:hypothetical protein
MQIFGKIVTAAFIGKIAASIFLAVCAFLGFGPDKWVAWVMGPDIAPWVARTVFVLLGLVTGWFLMPENQRERLLCLPQRLRAWITSYSLRVPWERSGSPRALGMTQVATGTVRDRVLVGADALPHNIDARAALHYAANRTWDPRKGGNQDAGELQRVFDALALFDASATTGGLRVWGRRSAARPHILVEPAHWQDWHIDYTTLFAAAGAAQIRTVPRDRMPSGTSPYYDLRLNKAEVERLWPPVERGRRLAEPQKDILIEELRERGFSGALNEGVVDIRYAAGCSECKAFAEQLADALALAGWAGDISTTLDEHTELTGLRIYLTDLRAKPRSAGMLASAFKAADIDFECSRH